MAGFQRKNEVKRLSAPARRGKTREEQISAMKPFTDFQKDLIGYLKSPDAAAEYLNAALRGGDPRVLYIALRNVAEAQGNMTSFAKKCKISRTNLYHMTSKKGNPSLESILRVIRCFGLDLSFTPNRGGHSKPLGV